MRPSFGFIESNFFLPLFFLTKMNPKPSVQSSEIIVPCFRLCSVVFVSSDDKLRLINIVHDQLLSRGIVARISVCFSLAFFLLLLLLRSVSMCELSFLSCFVPEIYLSCCDL